MRLPIAGTLAGLALLAAPASAIDYDDPGVADFIEEMTLRHGFDPDQLRELFAQTERKETVLDAMSRPAEKVLTWGEYRELFLTEERIDSGARFWRDNHEKITTIASASGVPGEIMVAVLGVETFYGTRTGDYRVIDALATLAFYYPRRGRFFRSELEQFLLLTREENIDPLTPTGSYAGAMGRPQFMPSSYRRYAVDMTEDGQRDIWTNWTDVLGSIANYLSEHGWRANAPIVAPARNCLNTEDIPDGNGLRLNETVGSLRSKGIKVDTDQPDDTKAVLITLVGENGQELWVGFRNFYAITRYNRSKLYAMAVHELGEAINGRLADSQD